MFEQFPIHFLTKPLDKILTRSLLSKFEIIMDKDNLDKKLFEIDIVIGSDNRQGNFRWVGKFIMRDKEGYNKDSCVIKNGHIDWTKDAYEIFQRSLANPINNRLKYLMHDNYYLYFKWEEDGILELSYEEKVLVHYLIIYHLNRFPQNF